MCLVNKRIIFIFLSFWVVSQCSLAFGGSYSRNAEARALILQLVSEDGLDSAKLEEVFLNAKRKDSILNLMRRPAEKTKTWHQYRDIFVTTRRIREGLAFFRQNETLLKKAEVAFDIPASIIVSIIGVETSYGSNTGNYRVIDALSTLAFDYPVELKNFERRKSFFIRELKNFLVFTDQQELNPLLLKGSYAGAMGLGQFMPSSYRAYAVDFDDDGQVDIWKNIADAIGSIANYLARHGWRKGELIASTATYFGNKRENWINSGLKPIRTVGEFQSMGFAPEVFDSEASLATAMVFEGSSGEEFWMGFQNFYVITRYNHSAMYALSVFQLARAIDKRLSFAN